MLVACDGRRHQAHYICAALNSSPAVFTTASYALSTSTSTHVLENILVPSYRAGNPLHKRLADLSHQAHKAAARGLAAKLEEIEREIDKAAAKLWGLTSKELDVISRALDKDGPAGRLQPTSTPNGPASETLIGDRR